MGKKSKTSGAPSPVMGEGAAPATPAVSTAALDTSASNATVESSVSTEGATTPPETPNVPEAPKVLEAPEVPKVEKVAETPKAAAKEKADGSHVDFSKKDFPLTLKAVNNTPISLFLAEAGVMLAPNFEAPHNASVVTFLSADHFAREVSNVAAIASAHDFTDALLLEELPVGSTQ